ncbi:2',3'-cyclic nucleotide 3'-phosphodiesterase [Savitreella phatthalungensis]
MSLGGSFWLVPDLTSPAAAQLQRCLEELGNDKTWGEDVSDPFSCHATITSSISAKWLTEHTHENTAAAGAVSISSALGLAQPKILIKEIVIDNLFFKRIYLRLERTESLLALTRAFRQAFVDEHPSETENFLNNFDPHISLAYAKSFDHAREKELRARVESLLAGVLHSDLSSVMTHVKLMDCRSPPGKEHEVDTAKNWRPAESLQWVRQLKRRQSR